MGSYLTGSTTGPRQSRRLATSAIGLVAVIGLVTACTASSVGAAKRAPDRYPAGATVQAQAKTGATTSADSPQSLRLEQQIRRSGGTITDHQDAERIRADPQRASARQITGGPRLPRPVGCTDRTIDADRLRARGARGAVGVGVSAEEDDHRADAATATHAAGSGAPP